MGIKIEGKLIEGVFIKRINRFTSDILVEGKLVKAHVPNTGRMKELLINGARVIVRRVNDSTRKTGYDLLMVFKENQLVLIDSRMPNKLLENAFRNNILKGFKKKYSIKREVKYGNSRFDFTLINDEEIVLVEAKCVTLVKENGIASFPDAPTERGRKHLFELIEAKRKGFKAVVFFIIQREDAVIFTPNGDMDKEFSDAVKEAMKNGVEFYAYTCKVNLNNIEIKDKIPIIIS